MLLLNYLLVGCILGLSGQLLVKWLGGAWPPPAPSPQPPGPPGSYAYVCCTTVVHSMNGYWGSGKPFIVYINFITK